MSKKKEEWSLPKLLAGLHDEIQTGLTTARETLAHPGTKGDACEDIWLELLNKYLPQRYQAKKAHVVDSKGHFSEQIDVLVFDRQYSPFIFDYKGKLVVPAESVYAVFEAKQTITAGLVRYAQKKVASVRRLHRTSLPIPAADRVYPAKVPIPIIGGFLALESEWKPPLGKALTNALNKDTGDGRLDLGCVAAHGIFTCDASCTYEAKQQGKPATAFLFELIKRLQASATVPMIDISAYAEWLTK
jgi:hypothetical protein